MMLLSASIGALIAIWIYKRSSNDLKKEAAELRKLNTLILRALEDSALAKLNRDSEGNIIGLIFDVEVQSAMHFQSSTEAEVTRHQKHNGSNNDTKKK